MFLFSGCVCLRMQKGLPFNTVTSPVFVYVCVCCTAFWKFKPTAVLWPTWSLKRYSFSLLWVYQHNAAHWDKWRQLLQYWMGSFGAWIINIFTKPFHSLYGVLSCYGRWHPAVGRALGWESVTALCQLLWSAASTQSPGYNVLFMANNQDLTSKGVLKWYLWRGLSSAEKVFKNTLIEKKQFLRKPHTQKNKSGYVFIMSSLNPQKRGSCWLCNGTQWLWNVLWLWHTRVHNRP